jgi:hypothetical protein
LGAPRPQPVQVLTRFALIAPDQLNQGGQTKSTVKHQSKRIRVMVTYLLLEKKRDQSYIASPNNTIAEGTRANCLSCTDISLDSN